MVPCCRLLTGMRIEASKKKFKILNSFCHVYKFFFFTLKSFRSFRSYTNAWKRINFLLTCLITHIIPTNMLLKKCKNLEVDFYLDVLSGKILLFIFLTISVGSDHRRYITIKQDIYFYSCNVATLIFSQNHQRKYFIVQIFKVIDRRTGTV